MTDKIELPPLPESQANGDNTTDYFGKLFEYTADQMRAYGQACIEADRTARAAAPAKSVGEDARLRKLANFLCAEAMNNLEHSVWELDSWPELITHIDSLLAAPALPASRALHEGERASDEPEDGRKCYWFRFGWNAYREAMKGLLTARTVADAPAERATGEKAVGLLPEMVQYEHGNGGVTFFQFAKDPLPKWATNVRPFIRAGADSPTAADAVARIPEGYALMPVTPNEQMLDAIAGTKWASLGRGKQEAEVKAYQAMLAAAPRPPAVMAGGLPPLPEEEELCESVFGHTPEQMREYAAEAVRRTAMGAGSLSERDAFESHIVSIYGEKAGEVYTRCTSGHYHHSFVQHDWTIWQASRRAASGAVDLREPTQAQFEEWCERHDMRQHLHREAFEDAASLYLTNRPTANGAAGQDGAA